MRRRNTRQSEAASDAARVRKHEAGVCGHGGHAHRWYLGGSGGEYLLFEVPFCECAMRGSLRPHPTLLVSSITKWAYAVTADTPIVGIPEGPGVNIAYSRSHFANTQCESARDRIPLCVCLHARSDRVRSRWRCLLWVSPRARGEYRLLEVPFF